MLPGKSGDVWLHDLITSKFISNEEETTWAPIISKGYETYAVTKGGKGIIKFSDNSDITTDRETSTVEVVPKESGSIKFVPRGRNNNMMYDIMKKIGANVTVGSNVEFKNKVVYGDSVLVYRKYRDKETRKIIKEEVLPEEYRIYSIL